MSRHLKIERVVIGTSNVPVVIAEMSGNHNRSLERALCIVDAAAAAGVHGLKIQTYKANTMTLDIDHGDFLVSERNSLWKGSSLYKLYEAASTPWEWHDRIFRRAREHGLVAFSTPFDETAVDFLESLEVPCYKIASFENTDLPLIRKVAKTGKPMIISTGMANVAELDETVRTARDAGCQDLILLKCTSTYPASPQNSNVRTIPHLRNLFSTEVGLSDHTRGIGAAVAAVAMGATVIEKHFTLKRSDGGVDAAFSMEPQEMAALVRETKQAWQALGKIRYGPSEEEMPSIVFRRSLYITKDSKAGVTISRDNVRALRPGYGLPPKYIDIVLGRRFATDAAKGTPLTWDLVL